MNDFPLVSKCQIDGKDIEVTLLNVFEHEDYPDKQYIIYSVSNKSNEDAIVNIGILLEYEKKYRIVSVENKEEQVVMYDLLEKYIEILEEGEENG